MAQQNIGVGTIANDGTGDTLRTAMIKTQNNFSEIYAATINAASNSAHTVSMSNGYMTMPNGIKMMWGTLTTANTTGQLITYSTTVGVAFTTNCFSVTATANSIAVDVAVTTVNSTALTLITNSATATTAYWQAWGI